MKATMEKTEKGLMLKRQKKKKKKKDGERILSGD